MKMIKDERGTRTEIYNGEGDVYGKYCVETTSNKWIKTTENLDFTQELRIWYRDTPKEFKVSSTILRDGTITNEITLRDYDDEIDDTLEDLNIIIDYLSRTTHEKTSPGKIYNKLLEDIKHKELITLV